MYYFYVHMLYIVVKYVISYVCIKLHCIKRKTVEVYIKGHCITQVKGSAKSLPSVVKYTTRISWEWKQGKNNPSSGQMNSF